LGTNLQVSDCPILSGGINSNCVAAFAMLLVETTGYTCKKSPFSYKLTSLDTLRMCGLGWQIMILTTLRILNLIFIAGVVCRHVRSFMAVLADFYRNTRNRRWPKLVMGHCFRAQCSISVWYKRREQRLYEHDTDRVALLSRKCQHAGTTAI
jgi:hypothetical protein